VNQSALKLALGTLGRAFPAEAGSRSPNGEIVAASGDIEDRLAQALQRNQALERLNSCFEAALNHMGRGLSMFDADQRLVVCNKVYADIYFLPEALTRPGTAFAEILAYHMRRVTGETPSAAGITDWIEQHVTRLAQDGTLEQIQNLDDGRVIRVTYHPLDGGGWVDMQEDITAQRRSDEKIKWLARHDTLTEVPNRFHFRECLEQQFECYDPRLGFALHWIDLDHFKEVNDKYGHLVGDGLLKSVANRLKSSLRAGDMVGRLGGDEFAVLQAGIDREELADDLAHRLLENIRRPYDILGHRLHTDASIGVALAPKHGQDPEELFASADMALYRAKSLGRGVQSVYAPDAAASATTATSPLKAELQRAVERKELVLHYHPIVDIKEERVSSFEALMRWKHPSRGLIPPSEFIPIAEESRLIVTMGSWALTQACLDAKSWPETIKVSVNLSAVQIDSGDVYDMVTRALEASGLTPERLQLEITETVLMRDREHTKEVLQKLHDLGVTITLDDFGTCFATLNYLRSFPFKKIKIDRSFVRDIPEHHDCVAIVKSVGELARELNMRSVAEGVETAASLATIRAAGYDEVQGFYFSPPVPARAVQRAINQCKLRLTSLNAVAPGPVKGRKGAQRTDRRA
jgi:diguanylate cyclase (GGDEF)-like protein